MEKSACSCKSRLSSSIICLINNEDSQNNEKKRFISWKNMETTLSKLCIILKSIVEDTSVADKMK